MVKFCPKASIVILLALLASGCCLVAPLSSNFTARSLGAKKIGLDAAVQRIEQVGFNTFKIAIGLSKDLDFGLQLDGPSIGVFGKYSFVNNKEQGFSLAGVLGAGAVDPGAYAYGGPVLSYKSRIVEPYFVGRLNLVHYGEQAQFLMDPFGVAGNYTYLQFTLGSLFWFTESIGLNVEGTTFTGNMGVQDLEGLAVPRFTFLAGVKFRF